MIGLHHQHPRWYAPLWRQLPQYRLLAAYDPDERFLRPEIRAIDANLDAYTNYRRLLERDDIDVVIIWLPHGEMPRAVEEAAAAGKHVIVEKPCCADLAGARQILDTAKRYPRIKISAPYCWRTHPASRRIREAMDQGLFGELTAAEARLNAGGAWRYPRDNAPWMLRADQGGGPMWNLGVHWIDYLRWVTGMQIVSIIGQTSGPIGEPTRDIEDNSQAILRFYNGATAIIDISYGLTDIHPGSRDIYLAWRGSHGALQWAPAWEGVEDELLIVSRSDAARSRPVQRIRITRRDVAGYGGEMALNWLADFASAVNTDLPPPVDAQAIFAAVAVADAFYRSVASGQAEPVSCA